MKALIAVRYCVARHRPLCHNLIFVNGSFTSVANTRSYSTWLAGLDTQNPMNHMDAVKWYLKLPIICPRLDSCLPMFIATHCKCSGFGFRHTVFLQHLQSGSRHGDRRWLLKTPQHLDMMEEVLFACCCACPTDLSAKLPRLEIGVLSSKPNNSPLLCRLLHASDF